MIDTERRPKQVQLARIGLEPSPYLEDLSWRRLDVDYFSGSCRERPPANVKRQLFFASCIENLKNAGQELRTSGVSDLKLFIAKQYLPERSGSVYSYWPSDLIDSSEYLPEYLPTETGVSYRYRHESGEETRIAGSPVISALHGLSLEEYLSDEERTKIISHHFNNYLRYLPDHDVTVIAIPPRRREGISPTHEAFVPLAVPHPVTDKIVEHTDFDRRKVDLYFFPHGEGDVRAANIKKAQNLMTDIRYRRVLRIIDGAWARNFRSEEVQREQDEHLPLAGYDLVLARIQIERMNAILRANVPKPDEGERSDHSITVYEYPGMERYPVGYAYK